MADFYYSYGPFVRMAFKDKAKKSLEQEIASAQMRLNRLRSKEKSLSKSAETRLKITLGAEVAKYIVCKVEKVDKEFVLGILMRWY